MDAVAAGLAAHQVDGIPLSFGHGAGHFAMLHHADSHGVDNGVALVGVGNDNLSTHGGDAEAVAIIADALDHLVEEKTVVRIIQAAEPQGVEGGHGPSTHGEDVAHDAAHAGRRALIRLNG